MGGPSCGELLPASSWRPQPPTWTLGTCPLSPPCARLGVSAGWSGWGPTSGPRRLRMNGLCLFACGWFSWVPTPSCLRAPRCRLPPRLRARHLPPPGQQPCDRPSRWASLSPATPLRRLTQVFLLCLLWPRPGSPARRWPVPGAIEACPLVTGLSFSLSKPEAREDQRPVPMSCARPVLTYLVQRPWTHDGR